MSRNIDNYEEVYLKSNFEKEMVRIRRRKVLEIMNDLKPKRILEIGCGIESIFKFYSDFELFTVVEPSRFFVEIAKKEKENYSEKNIIIYQDLVENIINELKRDNYDLILLSGLLHEVKSPQYLISEIKKIMTTDTILHVNVPNSNSFHRVLAKEAGLIKTVFELSPNNIKLQQNTVFNLENLEKLSTDNDFIVQSKGSYFIKPFTHEQMQNLLDENIIDSRVISGFYNMAKYMPNMGAEIFVNLKQA